MRRLWNNQDVLGTVRLDIDRALSGPNSVFREGDQIHIWTFDLKVQEIMSAEVKLDSEAEVSSQVTSTLNRLRVNRFGTTSLAKPLKWALEKFRRADWGELNLLLYTDGKNSIGKEDVASIRRYYNYDYKSANRLANLHLVQFGSDSLPETTREVITSLAGRIVSPGTPLSSPVVPPEPKPVTTTQSIISVSPSAFHFEAPVAMEIAKPLPIEFALDPPVNGLSVALSLQTTNLAGGMTITTTADHLATQGKQSVSFLIRNPQPGHYSAKLKLSSTVPIRPDMIPVDIDILPANPDNVVIQFFPEHVSQINLASVSRWQKLQGIGVSFFYPEKLRNKLARLEVQTPSGSAIRMLPSESPDIPISSGGAFRLGNIGRSAEFEILSTSLGIVDQPLEARLSVTIDPGQNISSLGTNSLTVPFQFTPATEVEIETSEILLGDIPIGVRTVKGTVILSVRGKPNGTKLAVVKQGQGLAGIEIHPSEITLAQGTQSIDLEFIGFDERQPGPVKGEFVMIPKLLNPALYVPVSPINVSGSVAEPSQIIVEIENPMVVNQPLVIRARFDSGEKGVMAAIITPPNPGPGRPIQIDLADSGSAEDNDAKAGDGTYSATFNETDQLGLYRIVVTGTSDQTETRTASINVPIHFQGPSEPLTGTLSRRRTEESIEFKPEIISDFPGAVTMDVESESEGMPLSTYLSSKKLEPGKNSVGLLVRLTPEAGSGDYVYYLSLATETIDGVQARIPLVVNLKVESLFQYFMKLLGFAVAVGFCVTIANVVPWNRVGWVNRLRGRKIAQLPSSNRFDGLD